jgi:aryl-alcohol dehydrogenase-like predicted oxidoreductase
MRYRRLGRTGFDVSEIGHGLWGMGGWSGSEDQQSMEALQKSVDLGCNFFDTAWAYGEGKSDVFLGKLIKQNPGTRLYAASKIPPMNRQWPARPEYTYDEVFPREHVFKYTEQIRKALQQDTIDVLQFHVWNDDWSNEQEFLDTVDELKNKKLIHAFGLSINRWEPENGIKALRTGRVDAVQVIYNIFDQNPEDKLFPVCEELNVGVIARVPFDEGSLVGNISKETKFPEDDWRAHYFGPANLGPTVDRVEKLKKDVPQGISLPELALRFILSDRRVSTTIPGMRKPNHVAANLGTSDKGALSSGIIEKLRAHRWERRPSTWSD